MPELPEVETIVRQLAPRVRGRTVRAATVLDPRWSAPLPPARLEEALGGRRIARLGRRGKYLVWSFEDGACLVQHLRMSGLLLYDPRTEPAHVRVRLELDDGRRVVVCDPRRFGTAALLEDERALERFFAARLGLEPFDERFTAAHLRALVRARRAPLKAVLLDQRAIAGVGNIYADEALFRARLHPARPAARVSTAQCDALRAALIAALAAGIDARGASISDFRDTEGARGSFQDRFLVHRRAGCPCPRCGAAIVKTAVAGRGTYLCPRCQRLPRPRALARETRAAPASPRSRRSGARRRVPGGT